MSERKSIIELLDKQIELLKGMRIELNFISTNLLEIHVGLIKKGIIETPTQEDIDEFFEEVKKS